MMRMKYNPAKLDC